MCGILGEVTARGEAVGLTDEQAERWLLELDHRGPDGRGLWRGENVLLGHTRLAVRDPRNDAAAQPITTPCGRYALAYNGELYNDAELRASLEPEVLLATGGAGFRTTCDAETVLWALTLGGRGAIASLRGMFALAFVDLETRTVLLSRDPLGVKPLVWAKTPTGLAFASEPRALVAHPGVRLAPDLEMFSAYLATSRRTLAGRTLFEGVEAVEAGQTLLVDLCKRRPRPVQLYTPGLLLGAPTADPDPSACRSVVTGSVLAHLVSDVPVCAMLSGGLDSTIIASVVAGRRDDLETWCASGVDRGREVGPDPAEARALAEELGTRHHDVHLQGAEFMRAWREHVAHLGQPLSTPNEVAIARLASAIRGSGARVALSGEGADELFGGYDAVLSALAAHGRLPDPPIGAARFHLEAAAWVSPAAQDGLLRGEALGRSEFVIDAYERAYSLSQTQMRGEGDALDAHLQLQRRFNLNSLLERLDAATMRHGVEGRTPFADVEVARYAESLPMDAKFVDGEGRAAGSKIILRRAFSGTVPERVEKRPKASFPLPFETWCAPVKDEIGASGFLAEWVAPEVLRAVASDPATHWRLTWLLGNLALWGDAVFGASSVERRAA